MTWTPISDDRGQVTGAWQIIETEPFEFRTILLPEARRAWDEWQRLRAEAALAIQGSNVTVYGPLYDEVTAPWSRPDADVLGDIRRVLGRDSSWDFRTPEDTWELEAASWPEPQVQHDLGDEETEMLRYLRHGDEEHATRALLASD